jgi:hypothetical protein
LEILLSDLRHGKWQKKLKGLLINLISNSALSNLSY